MNSKKRARTKQTSSGPLLVEPDGGRNLWEVLGIAVLLALAIFFLTTSWRKWPDSLIDFGNGLYIAWRLANGAILYRDVDVDYGPLSQYVNGTLFGVFGPGMMVLVGANLIVFVAILSTIYLLFRRAWGILPAFAASAIFIIVFGFSQSVVFGNYNYVTPYSQETTHGFLICLLLVAALLRWTESYSLKWSLCSGLLFGLTAVLKPEFMLAAAAIIITAVLATRSKDVGFLSLTSVVGITIGAVVPTLAFGLYFSVFVDWQRALADACHAWLSTARLGGDMAQMRFLGFDFPWRHLGQHLLATFWAVVFISGISGASWLADRKIKRSGSAVVFAACFAIGIGMASYFLISWREVGRCFLGLAGVYAVLSAVAIFRNQSGRDRKVQTARLLLSVLAIALLSRMVLNGRYYQYGYYQAALAAIIVPAVLIRELPVWLNLHEQGRRFIIIGCTALILPGLMFVVVKSQNLLRLKTTPVAEGRDRFYTYPRGIDAQGELVDRIAKALGNMPDIRTLVVLPEGAMINYLARIPSPIASLFFYSGITENGGEEKVVEQLGQRPPDSIVIISRDMRDYGIVRYGERPGAGEEIMRWVTANYQTVAKAGGDPFDFNQRGAIILRRKSSAP